MENQKGNKNNSKFENLKTRKLNEKKAIYELKFENKIKCIELINNNSFLALGDSEGFIILLEITENSNLKEIIKLQGDKIPILILSEIKINSRNNDSNKANNQELFISAGYTKSLINIFKIFPPDKNNNFDKYEIIQSLQCEHDSCCIQKLLFLKNNNLMLSSDYNNIILWSPEINDNLFNCEKIKVLPMKHVVDDLIEIDEETFAACQYMFETVKFFSTKENFKLIKALYNIKITCFSNRALKLIKKGEFLLVCNLNGFTIISVKYKEVLLKIDFKTNIRCIEKYYDEFRILCSVYIYKENERGNSIIEYKINEEDIMLEKVDEIKNIHEGSIKDIKYLTEKDIIISTGDNDGFIKLWK